MSNTELAGWLDELESKYDKQFKVVLDAIRTDGDTGARSQGNWFSFAVMTGRLFGASSGGGIKLNFNNASRRCW